MDNVKQTGKKLYKNAEQTKHNTRRKKENFLKPEAVVDNLNLINTFKTGFQMDSRSTARLNLKINPVPVPCTVNPPILNSSATAYLTSDSPGFFGGFTSTTGDYELVDGGIKVPYDGCYSVHWNSGAWGVGYFGDRNVTVQFTHNGYVYRAATQPTTGAIIILGPTIYVYVAPSPLYAVVAAKAGDVLGVILTQFDIAAGYPWLGGPLGGFFYNPPGYSLFTVTLIASAEA